MTDAENFVDVFVARFAPMIGRDADVLARELRASVKANRRTQLAAVRKLERIRGVLNDMIQQHPGEIRTILAEAGCCLSGSPPPIEEIGTSIVSNIAQSLGTNYNAYTVPYWRTAVATEHVITSRNEDLAVDLMVEYRHRICGTFSESWTSYYFDMEVRIFKRIRPLVRQALLNSGINPFSYYR